MEPSQEAIEATVQVCLHNDSNYPSRWVNKLLQAAYAIDFAALQQENARLKEDIIGANRIIIERDLQDLDAQLAASEREVERLNLRIDNQSHILNSLTVGRDVSPGNWPNQRGCSRTGAT